LVSDQAARYGLARQHLDQYRAVRRRYLYAHRLAAVTRVAFFVSAGAFLCWASPFLPRGLDPRTYAGPAAIAAAFGSMALMVWGVSTLLSLRATGRRRVMAPWASMFDDDTGVYNRAYFMDTLDQELARAETSHRRAGVYVMQVARVSARGDVERLTAEDTDLVIACLHETLGRDDTLATLRPDEFAALVVQNPESVSQAKLASRLREAFDAVRHDGTYRLRIGQALSEPGRDARWMLDVARAELRASAPALISAAA
jgi:GGDEF domain-containing protein